MITFEGAQFRTDIASQAAAAGTGETASGGGLTYADAGVDINAGEELVQRIKPFCKATKRKGCDAAIGGFGSIFDLKAAGFKDPLLVSGTDGVGTKLEIAKAVGDHTTIGIDLVAMCVNDILAHGADPLYFLDYFATSKLQVDQAAQVVQGIAAGCTLAGCALVGGETAEMPGMYAPGDYDVAGFAVGAVEREDFMPHMEDLVAGDVIIGLASSGIHSNGYSLVRKIVSKYGFSYDGPVPFPTSENDKLSEHFKGFKPKTLGKKLLTPTRIYCKMVLKCIRAGSVKAFGHITGGGLTENIVRILPDHLNANLDSSKWNILPVFKWLKHQGGVAPHEMAKTFNLGIGGVIVAAAADEAKVLECLASMGEAATVIGRLDANDGNSPRVGVSNLEESFGDTQGLTINPDPALSTTSVYPAQPAPCLIEHSPVAAHCFFCLLLYPPYLSTR